MKWNWDTGLETETRLEYCWFWYSRGLAGKWFGATDGESLRRIFLGPVTQ